MKFAVNGVRVLFMSSDLYESLRALTRLTKRFPNDRISCRVRRTMAMDRMPTPDIESRYRFGPYELSLEAMELLKDGRHIRIQEQPLRILVALVQQPQRLVTRKELRRILWRSDVHVDFQLRINK